MSSESDSFEYVQVLFGRAEDAIKRYERISLSVLTPAVNQLRYAGHHLIASVNAEDDEVKKFQLYKAARHCERAYYDSLECTLSELLGFFARFAQLLTPRSAALALRARWHMDFAICSTLNAS